jgi:hypothetical protein
MCKAASFVLTKDAVYWSKTSNSHEEIIREFNLPDGHNSEVACFRAPLILRVEITPNDDDYSTDPATWTYHVDQDALPEWTDGTEEQMARECLPEWQKYHCCIQEGQMLVGGFQVVQKSGNRSTQTAGNRSTQTAGYRSTQTAGYRSTQTAGNESTQTAGNRSTQTAGYRSTQTAGDESTQTAGDESTQTAGVGTVQIARWYANGWRVATRVITEAEAGKPYKVIAGVWTPLNSGE